MENCDFENGDLTQNLQFPEIPKFNSTSSQSLIFSHNMLNDKKTSIVLNPQNKYKLTQKFSCHLDIPEIEDWVN